MRFAPDPPPPPPLEVQEGFETPRPAGTVPRARAIHENKPHLLSVTEETAAAGRRSLKVRDAPGLEFGFNPHFFYVPLHTEGTTRCTFDIRVEPATVMYHEWRDDSRPYRVGPSVWIRDGKLSAVGRNLLELPLGQWVHLEIAAGLV